MPLTARLAVATALIAASAAVHADTYSCDLAVGSVSFGRYERAATLTGTGTVSLSCTLTSGLGQEGAPYSLSMSTGQSGDYAARRLTTDTASTLEYNLYTDSSYTTVWGDGSGGTAVVTGILTGASVSRSHTIHARIPSHQNTPKGSFIDPTVQVTLSFP